MFECVKGKKGGYATRVTYERPTAIAGKKKVNEDANMLYP